MKPDPPASAFRDAAPEAGSSLSSKLRGHDNALNFLRLVLASLVIIGHAFPTGGFEGTAFGIEGLAVDGFFVISGFLIAGSRVRLSFKGYLWRRALRIMPAFWACLLIIAFLFSPLVAWVSHEAWAPASAVGFVWRNAALWMNQWTIDYTLLSVPLPEVWNGSLWTLAYEFMAYLAAGILLSLGTVRKHAKPVLLTLLVLALVMPPMMHGPLDVTTNLYLNGMRLAGFFLAGMALWAWQDRIVVNVWTGLASSIAAVTLYITVPGPVGESLCAIPLAYGLLALGATLPTRVGSRNDISYGIYIYAFPVQQMLSVLALPPLLGYWGTVLVTLLVTSGFAALSWLGIEKPLMRFKRVVK